MTPPGSSATSRILCFLAPLDFPLMQPTTLSTGPSRPAALQAISQFLPYPAMNRFPSLMEDVHSHALFLPSLMTNTLEPKSCKELLVGFLGCESFLFDKDFTAYPPYIQGGISNFDRFVSLQSSTAAIPKRSYSDDRNGCKCFGTNPQPLLDPLFNFQLWSRQEVLFCPL